MINLWSKTPHQAIAIVGEQFYTDYCGMLTTPQTGYDVSTSHRWALDNGCFAPGYDGMKIAKHLQKWKDTPGCLFAVVPDVVGNHNRTLHLFRSWIGVYRRLGYPPAFVIQDGCRVQDVPYNQIACVFIGGTDRYKYSQNVIEIVSEAKKHGLWVHAGRVGGKRRFSYVRDVLQCDSFDSTGFSVHPPKIIEERWIAEIQLPSQPLLFKDAA